MQRQHRDRAGQQQTVRYQYQGEYLQKVENPSQTTEYARDANGRVIEERVTLRTRAGHADTYVTKTAYDQLGRQHIVELPEGARLYYSYGAIGQLARVDYQARQSWWEKLLSRIWTNYGKQPLVSGIQTQSAFGVTEFTYGNGEKAQALYDRRGQLQTWRSGPLEASDGSQRHLLYGTRGELLEIRDGTKLVAHYDYNHLQQRVGKQTTDEQTQYLWHCRIPYDWIDNKRYPLFMAREVMRALIEQLQP